MLKFRVPSMKCGSCAKVVAQAITALDPSSKVDVDLEAREVHVTSSVDAPAILASLERAGYPAESGLVRLG